MDICEDDMIISKEDNKFYGFVTKATIHYLVMFSPYDNSEHAISNNMLSQYYNVTHCREIRAADKCGECNKRFYCYTSAHRRV